MQISGVASPATSMPSACTRLRPRRLRVALRAGEERHGALLLAVLEGGAMDMASAAAGLVEGDALAISMPVVGDQRLVVESISNLPCEISAW